MPDNSARVQRFVIQVVTTKNMRDALDAHAGKLGLSLSEYCRNTLAATIGYDISLDATAKSSVDRRGRPVKYNSDTERKQAKNERERKTRANTRQILDDYRHQLHLATGQTLAKSLESDSE